MKRGSSDTSLETRCFRLQSYINKLPIRAKQREEEPSVQLVTSVAAAWQKSKGPVAIFLLPQRILGQTREPFFFLFFVHTGSNEKRNTTWVLICLVGEKYREAPLYVHRHTKKKGLLLDAKLNRNIFIL